MRFDERHPGLLQVEGGVVIAALLRCPLQEAKALGNFSVRMARCTCTPSFNYRRPPSRHQWSPRPPRQCLPTSMAVRGLWREAWNSAQFTCCTGHRALLLLER